MTPKRYLIATLLALALLYGVWFAREANVVGALLVFILPPTLLAIAAAFDWKRAGFTAAVLALFWFSHGVMAAYSRPAEAGYAWAEIALALAVVLASSWPGLRTKFRRRS